MPIVLFIQILLGILFAPALLKSASGASKVALGPEGLLATLNGETPASTTPTTGTVNNVVSKDTPGAKAETPTSANDIWLEAVRRPLNWFGLALLVGGSVFLIAQTRAAAHEASGALGDAYQETKNIGGSLRDADGSTGNISRRLKK